MALLPNITYAPGESMQNCFDKINGAINTINSVLGGGASGQFPVKTSNADFAFSFVSPTTPVITLLAPIAIGVLNMDVTSLFNVAHGLADITKIRSIDVMIIGDNGFMYPYFSSYKVLDPEVVSGAVLEINVTNVRLIHNNSSAFNGANFDSLSSNRGWVTIGVTP